MSYQFVTVTRDGHLTVVTIERADSFNALNAPAHDELASIFDDFSSDDSQWVAIITGAGEKAFCAGHDLKQQAAGGGLEMPPSGFGGLTSRFNLSKPVIAAVNGVAFGGGFEIALACDLVIAAENAVFALPEPRVGLAALAGGVHRLPRQIGLKRAMGLMLTGERVTARQGLDLGFVNDVAPVGEALSRAKHWAARILESSPLAVRATKEATMRALAMDVEAAMTAQWGFDAMKAMLQSADAIEGPRAFSEKRKPVWTGR